MRRAACGEVCPPAPALHPPTPNTQRSENKELLRQQLLSAKERHSLQAEKPEAPKPKQQRNRQKNRWKLKFHHQALPQEYLDHYEQTLQRQAKNNPKPKAEKPKSSDIDNNNVSNEAFKLWAQKLAGHSENMNKSPKLDEKKRKSPNKVVTYEDLPYMGEMTLNNSKPRRGRKPKKADICHLIYENYGTVVPGQPPPTIDSKFSQLSSMVPFKNDSTAKTDLQNKIISSLLERKLSQDRKRLEMSPPSFGNPDDPMPEAPVTIAGPLHSDDEPLNLCIRDLHELKIQIQKKFGNIYTSLPEVKTEEIHDEKTEQPNAISVIQRNINVTATAASSPDLSIHRPVSPTLSEPAVSTPNEGEKFPVYWPNLYMHPLALQTQLMYYQRLAGQMPFSNEEHTTTDQDSAIIDDSKNKLVLKEISELLDPNVVKQVEESKKSPDPTKMKRSSPNPVQNQPTKRKRSAIFIPPVPSKSGPTTPNTEVSICKFKFTGGSKPSLQEKKMLSVDSGGNFRYYSGTGVSSKGNKGYDYLQRDSNQGRAEEKKESPTVSKEDLSKKKRKSRKSLQREKLEQTFKEKGFLIQTQQLQSAEGATYCKFRQLRKFTRYLFRSWKDYLPGELNDGSVPQGSRSSDQPEIQDAPSGSNSLPPNEEWR